MKKKGQGLPLNVIVIAILVLLVLVVVSVLFLSNIVMVPKTIKNCEKLGYICMYSCADDPQGIYTKENNDAQCYDSSGKKTAMKCCMIGG